MTNTKVSKSLVSVAMQILKLSVQWIYQSVNSTIPSGGAYFKRGGGGCIWLQEMSDCDLLENLYL